MYERQLSKISNKCSQHLVLYNKAYSVQLLKIKKIIFHTSLKLELSQNVSRISYKVLQSAE